MQPHECAGRYGYDAAVSDDASLFAAWCAGDRVAGATLFDRHYEAIARFFANKASGPAADDLVQATFLGCVEARARFRGAAGFRTFVFSVARNVLFNHYRAQRGPSGRIDFGEVSIGDLADSPSQVIHARQEQQLLLEALRRIPLECQVVLELLYWERMPVVEIAACVDAPVGTVKTRLRRGRLQLESQMRQLAQSPALVQSTLGGLETWAAQIHAGIAKDQ